MKKSSRLHSVKYDIRGPIYQVSRRLAKEGKKIIPLNIGNPAPFNLHPPQKVLEELQANLPLTDPYSESEGIEIAREAIAKEAAKKGIQGVTADHIFMGNGVSELIMMTLEALLEKGDEVLVPAPDYPLWTSSVRLYGGKAVHYMCDETDDWQPSIADIEAKVNDNTKAIVLINPNNPTGALYSEENLKAIAKIADKYGLIVFSDEIYDKVYYQDQAPISIAKIGNSRSLFVTFGGLSKNYCYAGIRAGWIILSGNVEGAKDYIEGLNLLASLRLCSNLAGQYATIAALNSEDTIYQLTKGGGRLASQRQLCLERINSIDGLSCVTPKGALYVFPKIEMEQFKFKSDDDFVLKLLEQHQVLLVSGTGFNWVNTDHFRLVYLAENDQLEQAFDGIEQCLNQYRR